MLTAACCVLLLSACLSHSDVPPTCGDEGTRTLFLMGQSVPDAALVPCIETLPAGWWLASMEIDSGGSRLQLVADQVAGAAHTVDVALMDRCDVSRAVQVPSDEVGAKRFEQVEAVTDSYAGTRYYVFEGGCVSYRFASAADGWTRFVHDASTMLGFVARSDLAELGERAAIGP